ncbi:MAG: hypothetical protein ABIG44_10425 [Planctomycetota bacterium]
MAILVLALTSCLVQAGDTGPDAKLSTARQHQILRDALNAYDEAVACTLDDAERAEELFRSAAAGFEALIASGRHNAALEYNLGNTQFRLGRLGRAIVHYRRAARLDPGNTKLQTNLAYARRQVEPYIEAGGQRRLIHQVLFWHYDTALTQRFWAALGLSLFGWLLLLARLRWDYRGLFIGGAVSVVLGLAAGTSVFVQHNNERQQPPAVIIGQEVVLRLGRGEAYEPALRQPLGAGVELLILQQRGDWLEVELPNQQTGWLPAASVERI